MIAPSHEDLVEELKTKDAVIATLSELVEENKKTIAKLQAMLEAAEAPLELVED